MLAGKTALVTGGAGFIGSHLVRALLAEGARVRVLDNLSTGRWENLEDVESEIVFCKGDVRNAIACRHACRDVTALFHLAAFISVPQSVLDPVTADAVNIAGTLNILMAARESGVRRFVFSSSSAVYGDTEELPTHEQVSTQPLSPYGLGKLYGEHMARIFHSLHGMETISLRYFNVYGPRQNPDSEYAAVIPKFISMLLANQRPTIFGDGEQTRDFLYVGDVVRANLLAAASAHAAGKVINIAGGAAISLNALCSVLRKVIQVDIEPVHLAPRPGDVRHSHADISRARALLGFEPATTLESGLERTGDAFRI